MPFSLDAVLEDVTETRQGELNACERERLLRLAMIILPRVAAASLSLQSCS